MGKKPVKKRPRPPPSISSAEGSPPPSISPIKKLLEGSTRKGEEMRVSSFAGDALRMLACSASDLKMKSVEETKIIGTVAGEVDDEDGKSSGNEEESTSKVFSEDYGNVDGQDSPVAEQLAFQDEQEEEEEEEEYESQYEEVEQEEEEELAEQSSDESNGADLEKNMSPHLLDSLKVGDGKQPYNSSSSGSDVGNENEEEEEEEDNNALKPELKSTSDNDQLSKKEATFGKRVVILPPKSSKKKRWTGNKVAEMSREKVRFMRIWSNEDELSLLQGILKYKDSHHAIPFSHTHAEILLKLVKDSLSISVSISQIVDKVRRMKRKYVNTIGRLSRFKQSKILDPHNAAVFNLSKKIWECLKEEPADHESKITVQKNSILKHFGEEYPSLYWRLKSEYSNVALIATNLMSNEAIKELEDKCMKLDKMNIQLNQQKIEFLASAVKLIEKAFDQN